MEFFALERNELKETFLKNQALFVNLDEAAFDLNGKE